MKKRGGVFRSAFWVLCLVVFSQNTFAQTRYDSVRQLLRDITLRFPNQARLINIGISDSGLPIEGLQIGQGQISNLVVATHHGNEYGSTEVAKALAVSLASAPIENQTVFLIPVLNISGYNSLNRLELANGNYHDPNRDYPGPCGTSGPFRLRSTAALAQLLKSAHIVSSATLHTFYPGVLYPWGISTHDVSTPYDEFFVKFGKLAAQESGYVVGNSTKILYPADGTFEDYAFWSQGTWSMLFELGYSHSPRQDAVKEMIRVNVPGIRRMLTMSPRVTAPRHNFEGRCDTSLRILDRRDE